MTFSLLNVANYDHIFRQKLAIIESIPDRPILSASVLNIKLLSILHVLLRKNV